MSLPSVEDSPMYNPAIPFCFQISEKLEKILSDLPTIICCLTTSKGFRTMLATISAQTEAAMFAKCDLCIKDLTVSYV